MSEIREIRETEKKHKQRKETEIKKSKNEAFEVENTIFFVNRLIERNRNFAFLLFKSIFNDLFSSYYRKTFKRMTFKATCHFVHRYLLYRHFVYSKYFASSVSLNAFY